MTPKILLIQPPLNPSAIGFRKAVFPEPTALILLASVLERAGFNAKIIDLRLSKHQETFIAATVKDLKPFMAGVTGFTTEGPQMRQVAEVVKKIAPETMVVGGGIHASMAPECFRNSSFDALIIGEGEKTIVELAKILVNDGDASDFKNVAGLALFNNGNITLAQHREHLSNDEFNNLPEAVMPDYLSKKPYRWGFWKNCRALITSRGCPFRCNFCSVWKMNPRVRMLSPELVVERIARISTPHVAIIDDNFFLSKSRAFRIAELLLARGVEKKYMAQVRSDSASDLELMKLWKETGLKVVVLGFEALSEKRLNSINKHNVAEANIKAVKLASKLGMRVWGCFIIDPDFTQNDFDEVLRFCREYKIAYPQFTYLSPLPGTDLYQEILGGSSRWKPIFPHVEAINWVSPCFEPTNMTLQDYKREFLNLYLQAYGVDRHGILERWLNGERSIGASLMLRLWLDNVLRIS